MIMWRPYSIKQIIIVQEMQNPLMQANYLTQVRVKLCNWFKKENHVVYGA